MSTKTITQLTSIQGEIVSALCQAVADLGGGRGLLCILGSWGDTLPDEEILEMLRDYNVTSEKLQRQADQCTSRVASDLPPYATPRREH